MKHIIPVFAVFLFLGCQPEPDQLKLYDKLLVQTHYDTEVDFSDFETYSLTIDTIGYVSSYYEDTIIVSPKHGTLARDIVNQIKLNMDNSGLQRVSRTADPDLGVIVFVVEDLNLYQQVIYPDSYYPYDYYNYYSYYAYPYVQTYASSNASLILELVDLKNKTPDNKVKVIWSAFMADLLSTLDRSKQCKDGIDQAFIQTPISQ